MWWTSKTRRVAVATFVFVFLVMAGFGWAEAAPEAGDSPNTVTLTHLPGLAVDASLRGRSETVAGSSVDLRLALARLRLGLGVLAGMNTLLAGTGLWVTRASPVFRPALSRRWNLALRAPPLLRVA